jgi:hypothetical protein
VDPQENLVPFDRMSATVHWSNQSWQLLVEGKVLKDFGRREHDARQALRIIHDLKLTHYGTVGGPNPIMEYWLASGQGPQGGAMGARTLIFDPSLLIVDQVQSQWCIRDPQRVWFNFGFQAEEAQRGLAIIHKYGFTQLASLGQGTTSMMVFLSRQGERASGTLVGPKGRASNQTAGAQANTTKLASKYPESNLGSLANPVLPPLQSVPRSAQGARHEFGESGTPTMLGGARKVAVSQTGAINGELVRHVPFDWRQAQVRQDQEGWKILTGGMVLASFGGDEHSARTALSAIHYYRFTEQCQVGQPATHFQYYMTNGQPPRGLMLGLSSQAFQPETVSVQQLGLSWAICSGSHVLLECGPHPEDARHLLEVIQRNKFDRLCRVGDSHTPGMTFLVKTR